MIDNPLVFKRKEKIDEIPEPEQEVRKIQSIPLNISLSQNPKRQVVQKIIIHQQQHQQ